MKAVLHMALAVVVACLLSSCRKDVEIIPRAEMSRIYADMLVADSWLMSASPEKRDMTDTTAFYEPVFKKYGYTTSDYLASVDYYLNDPERFSRILKKTQQILNEEAVSLQAEVEDQRNRVALGQAMQDGQGWHALAYTDYSELVRDSYYTDCMDIRLSPDGVYLPSRMREDVSFRGPRMILRSDVIPGDEEVKEVRHLVFKN